MGGVRPASYYRGGHPAPSIFGANEDCDEQNPLNNLTMGGKYGFGYGNFQHGGGLQRTVIANNTFYGATRRAVTRAGCSRHGDDREHSCSRDWVLVKEEAAERAAELLREAGFSESPAISASPSRPK